MEETDKLRVFRKHAGTDRVKEHEEENEERVNNAFELRQKIKKDAVTREEIIQSRGLSKDKEVTVETAEGPKEGTIDSFDENGRVWVRLADIIRGERIEKQMNLFEPIDVEPRN